MPPADAWRIAVLEQEKRGPLIRAIGESLAGYLARRAELTSQIARLSEQGTATTGFEAERASTEVPLLRSKLALYEGEIALLYAHLRRATEEQTDSSRVGSAKEMHHGDDTTRQSGQRSAEAP
jgi:hypothetical protein